MACRMVGFSMYLISSNQQTVWLVPLPGSARPAILVFIIRLQRVPCPSECIDNPAILVDVLATPQAIVGIVPFRHECIIKILREVGTK
jgi:hypothetical protein